MNLPLRGAAGIGRIDKVKPVVVIVVGFQVRPLAKRNTPQRKAIPIFVGGDVREKNAIEQAINDDAITPGHGGRIVMIGRKPGQMRVRREVKIGTQAHRHHREIGHGLP